MGSFRWILENLKTQIELEVVRPPNNEGSGGTAFGVDVFLGHENLSKLQGDRGRVVLSLHEDGADQIAPGKDLNGTLRSLCTWQPAFSASLWVPVGQAGSRVYLDRLDAIESLGRCVLRSLHEKFHGANVNGAPIADSASVIREPRHMKHGEAALVLFSVGVPITKGRTLTTLPAGASLSVNLRVNPES